MKGCDCHQLSLASPARKVTIVIKIPYPRQCQGGRLRNTFDKTHQQMIRENSYMTDITESRVYPGCYTPLPEMEALATSIRKRDHITSARPLVNMDETGDCYRIEVALPGAKREDILILVNDEVLSIVMLHEDCTKYEGRQQLHEFEEKCLERHILLPADADAGFMSAEFRGGILGLHIPKSSDPSPAISQQVVVY